MMTMVFECAGSVDSDVALAFGKSTHQMSLATSRTQPAQAHVYRRTEEMRERNGEIMGSCSCRVRDGELFPGKAQVKLNCP
jgi:hypothetical protein